MSYERANESVVFFQQGARGERGAMGPTGKPGEKVSFRLAHGTKPGINEDALRPGSFFLTSTHTWLPHNKWMNTSIGLQLVVAIQLQMTGHL